LKKVSYNNLMILVKLTQSPVRYDRRGTAFTEEVMGVKLSDVVVLKTKIETKLKKKRQVC